MALPGPLSGPGVHAGGLWTPVGRPGRHGGRIVDVRSFLENPVPLENFVTGQRLTFWKSETTFKHGNSPRGTHGPCMGATGVQGAR